MRVIYIGPKTPEGGDHADDAAERSLIEAISRGESLNPEYFDENDDFELDMSDL